MAPVSKVWSKIEIVWPHDNAPVNEANLANITAYLFQDPLAHTAVPCTWNPTVHLWAAYDNEPARPIAIGSKRVIQRHGSRFPAWDFNNIDISYAQDPAHHITFFATVDGVETMHNIWVHGTEARTNFLSADRPHKLTAAIPGAIDARIEVIYLHGNLPPEKATEANVSIYLFPHGKKDTTFGINWPVSPHVRLHWAYDNQPGTADEISLIGQPLLFYDAGIMHWVWNFYYVDVSYARKASHKIHFWVTVDGFTTYSSIWTYGTDGRTLFSQPDTPLGDCPAP